MGLDLPDTEPLTRIIRDATADLAKRVNRKIEDLPDPSWTSVVWNDSAMSIHPHEGEIIRRGLIPGYVLQFRLGQSWHRYHALETGEVKYDSRFEIGY